jgi:acid phosphatase
MSPSRGNNETAAGRPHTVTGGVRNDTHRLRTYASPWWVAWWSAASIRRGFVAASLGLCVAGASPTVFAAECTPPPSPPPVEAGQPPNLDLLKLQLTFYKCSGDYDRDVGAVVGQARDYLDKRAEGPKNLALVLDIDETSLSNWRQLEASNFGFIKKGSCTLLKDEPCGFDEWIAYQTADVIKPTLELFNEAKKRGVAVFFISSRREEQRLATVRNLRAAGYAGWNELILKQPGDMSLVSEFKAARRAEIETKKHFTIIANVGDQWSDLSGGHAERMFKIPNPFYFIP